MNVFVWKNVPQSLQNFSFIHSFLKPVFPFQDLISNSLYYLPYNSYEVSSENLVLDQLIIP